MTGSLERTIGILIEHFAGKFPVWLAPVQVTLIPIAERHIGKTREVYGKLVNEGIRCDVDNRSHTMQTKIKDASLQKIPYMGIIGDKEIKTRPAAISLRSRDGWRSGLILISDFVEKIQLQTKAKK